jgi:multimeric flavodoxin WrbA
LQSSTLLIAWHSRTGASRQLAIAAAEGAGSNGSLVSASEVDPAAMLAASGFLFVGPENLGSLSGAMKEMFDRCYYPLLGQLEGRAYATITAAGSDGTGAIRQLDRIVTGWRLRRVAEPVIFCTDAQAPESIQADKQIAAARLDEARELGAALAEGLSAGIF